MERHVPELHDWVKAKREAAPVMRCAVMGGLLVPGCPAATLDRRQRCRMQNVTTNVRRNQGWLQSRGRRRRNEACAAVRSLVF